jgi:dTDP-glucose 4,6-dehydratase
MGRMQESFVNVVVTGGAGFIGTALVRHLVLERGWTVTNIDKLTYAADLASLADLAREPNYRFVEGDICDAGTCRDVLASARPGAVIHLAAESHVDRSITGSAAFIQTNIVGTHCVLEMVRAYWSVLTAAERSAFRFLHVSTDEVFGSVAPGDFFVESTAYDPRSPYSASKAASDHLVRAWHHTFGLPVVITNCSNNYGPRQFPEKLMPLMILNALEWKPLPVYGDGRNVRDWLHVDDHVRALTLALEKGREGETYVVGGRTPVENIHIVESICDIVDRLAPSHAPRKRRELITFVEDRPGHDRRYAIDPSRIESELGWHAHETLHSGLEKTIRWYLDNPGWWRPLRERAPAGQRLGLVVENHQQ